MQRFLFIVLFASTGLYAADPARYTKYIVGQPDRTFAEIRALDIPEYQSDGPVPSLFSLAAIVVIENEIPTDSVPASCQKGVEDRRVLRRAMRAFKRERKLPAGYFYTHVVAPIVGAFECGLTFADAGCDINVLGARGWGTTKHYESLVACAAGWGLDNLVQALCDRGADLNCATGRTGAIEQAVEGQHPSTVRLLFARGAIYDFDASIYEEDAQVQPDQESVLNEQCDLWNAIELDRHKDMIVALAENGVPCNPCNPFYYDIVCQFVPDYREKLQAFNAAYNERTAAELEALTDKA